jgi:hypothetical protein
MNSAYNKLYKNLSGEITNEKAEFINSENIRLQTIVENMDYSREYNPDTYTGYIYGDSNLIRDGFYSPIKYAVTYKSWVEEVIFKAKENTEIYSDLGNEYDYRVNKQIIKNYENRQINNFYDFFGTVTFFQYIFSAILVILLNIILVTPLFISEKETEMCLLLSTCVKGRKSAVKAKITTVLLLNLTICLIFSVSDFAIFSLFYNNLDGWQEPLYAVEIFMNTPLNITVSEYFLLSKFLFFLGTSAIVLIMTAITKKFNNITSAYLVNTVIVIGLYAVYLLKGENIFKELNLFNPINLILPIEFFKDFETVNIFGFPVNTALLSVLCVVLLCCTMLFLLLEKFQGRSVLLDRIIKIRNKKVPY